MYKILDSIDSPADIKGLSIDELRTLCSEIRDYMVQVCAVHPGHLGSSLGAVELIVGMHYVFDTPSDKIVFDVGHQSYAHKIITGRRKAFETLRTRDGISGFPKMDESPYDSFGVGHSSTSISAALGMAEAAHILGRKEKVIALIGDGSLTGGLAFEGMNNAGDSKANLLIILNDNDHSIDDIHGGLHENLLRISTSHGYNTLKDQVWNLLGDKKLRSFIQRWIRSLKSWFVKKDGGDIFEALGLRYFGPINGNDIAAVVNTLKKLKDLNGPIMLHAITKKGAGYKPAEVDPTVWHAPGKFDPSTGQRIPAGYSASRFQDVFGETLCQMAGLNDKIVGITPAMASGCGMTCFAERFPERFFDVGIEEEHAVTFSAGLAASGMIPVCNIYSAFSQRAYDQIIHDVALQNIKMLLCFDRAGLVGEDGPTHHGVFDMAAYRSIPNIIIGAPSDEIELRNMMYTAVNASDGATILRYPRGVAEGLQWKDAAFNTLPVGKAVRLTEGDTVAVVALGPCVNRAVEAAEQFHGKVSVYNFRYLKPLDTDALSEIADKHSVILTIEDGCIKGGLFGAVCEWAQESGHQIRIQGIGIPDEFIPQGRQTEQRAQCGLDRSGIEKTLEGILQKY